MIDEIIRLIVEESCKIKNPDEVARLHIVFMQVSRALMDIMLEIREKERSKK